MRIGDKVGVLRDLAQCPAHSKWLADCYFTGIPCTRAPQFFVWAGESKASLLQAICTLLPAAKMLPHEPTPQTTVQHQALGNWVFLSRKDRGKESHCPQALAKGPSISNYSIVFATVKEAKEVTSRLSLVEQADPKHLTKKGDGGGCRQERRGCQWALPTAPTAPLMQDSSRNRDPARTCQETSRWRSYGF